MTLPMSSGPSAAAATSALADSRRRRAPAFSLSVAGVMGEPQWFHSSGAATNPLVVLGGPLGLDRHQEPAEVLDGVVEADLGRVGRGVQRLGDVAEGQLLVDAQLDDHPLLVGQS